MVSRHRDSFDGLVQVRTLDHRPCKAAGRGFGVPGLPECGPRAADPRARDQPGCPAHEGLPRGVPGTRGMDRTPLIDLMGSGRRPPDRRRGDLPPSRRGRHRRRRGLQPHAPGVEELLQRPSPHGGLGGQTPTSSRSREWQPGPRVNGGCQLHSAPPALHNANLSTELPGAVLSLVGVHAKVRRDGYRR